MSWPSRSARIALLAATCSLLAGCLRPMYGELAAGGPALQSELQSIAIEPIPDRIGHYLGDDLIVALNGTGSHPSPRYRLFVALNEGVQTPLIDTVSGRASAATLVVNADYRLVTYESNLLVKSGRAFVIKSYDRTSERFSNIRAARDAEIQNAKQLADQIQLQLASFLTSYHPQQAGAR